jgi:hypothetical protein
VFLLLKAFQMVKLTRIKNQVGTERKGFKIERGEGVGEGIYLN